MTVSTENPTLAKLEEKYNSTELRVNPFEKQGGRTFTDTVGERNRDGVCILGDSPDDYTINDSIVRWVSNDSVPPTDILEMAVVDGTITFDEFLTSIEVSSKESAEHLEAYFNKRAKHGYSEEEKAEMRANFGDEEVVDVFTGKEIDLC